MGAWVCERTAPLYAGDSNSNQNSIGTMGTTRIYHGFRKYSEWLFKEMRMQMSIDELRARFEASDAVRKFGIDFNEYAVLYRLREGVKAARVFESLYLSSSTIYRAKRRIAKKLKTRSFEEALIKAGEALFAGRKGP